MGQAVRVWASVVSPACLLVLVVLTALPSAAAAPGHAGPAALESFPLWASEDRRGPGACIFTPQACGPVHPFAPSHKVSELAPSATASSAIRGNEERNDNASVPRDPYCVDPGVPHRSILVYAHPRDGPDRTDLFAEEMRGSMRAANGQVWHEGMSEGVSMDLRVECIGGEMSVHTVELDHDAIDLDALRVADGVRAALGGDRRVQYWVSLDLIGYYIDDEGAIKNVKVFHDEGGNLTGWANAWDPDPSPDPTGKQYLRAPILDCFCEGVGEIPTEASLLQLNMDGGEACAACTAPVGMALRGHFGSHYEIDEQLYFSPSLHFPKGVLLHEALHNMGAVRNDAPGSNGQGHCFDGPDLMCYAQDGSPYPYLDPDDGKYTEQACTDRWWLDCGHDTYFDPRPDPASWVGQERNIANATQNRFIQHHGATDVPLRAVDDYYIVRSDELEARGIPLRLDVWRNDVTSEPVTTTITQLSSPTKGTVVQDGRSFLYVPDVAEVGTDWFQYEADDGVRTDVATVILDLDHRAVPIHQSATILEDSAGHDYETRTHCGDDGHFTDPDPGRDVYLNSNFPTVVSLRAPAARFPGGIGENVDRFVACDAIHEKWSHRSYTPGIQNWTWMPGQDFFGQTRVNLGYQDWHWRRDWDPVLQPDKDYGLLKYFGINARIDITVLPVNDPPHATGASIVVLEDEDGWAWLLGDDVDGQPQAAVHPASSPPVGYPAPWDTCGLGAPSFGQLRFTLEPPSVGSFEAMDMVEAGGGTKVVDVEAVLQCTLQDTRASLNVTFTPDADVCNDEPELVPFTVDDTEFQDTAAISVRVLCVNDAPSFELAPDITVPEDTPGQQVHAQMVHTISPGPGEDDEVTLNMAPGPTTEALLFADGPALDDAGTLRFTLAPDACGQAAFDVWATDDGGTMFNGTDTSGVQRFTIHVTCINDEPTLAGLSQLTLDEDAPLVALPAWGMAAPGGGSDESDQTLAIEVTVPDEAAGLFASGPTGSVAPDGTVRMEFEPAADASGQVEVLVHVRDSGPGTDPHDDLSQPVTLTITVGPVHDAPVFTPPSDVLIDEDAGPQSVAAWLAGITPGDGVTAVDGMDEADQGLRVALVPLDAGLFQDGPLLQLDAGGGLPRAASLGYTTAADVCTPTSSQWTVIVHDDADVSGGGENRSEATSAFTIRCINDHPVWQQGPDLVLMEDHDGAASFARFDPWGTGVGPGGGLDEVGQTLSFATSAGTSAALFDRIALTRVNTTDAALEVALAKDGCTPDAPVPVEATLSDDGPGDAPHVRTGPTKTFWIDILCLNDAPAFDTLGDVTVWEDHLDAPATGRYSRPWATGITNGGEDEADQTLTWRLELVEPAQLPPGFFVEPPSLDATGKLSFKLAQDRNHPTPIRYTVTLEDDGEVGLGHQNTSTIHFLNITVLPVNDRPSFAPGPTITVREDLPDHAGSYNVSWASGIVLGPAEEPTLQSGTFHLAPAPDPALFATGPTIDEHGDLHFTLQPDANHPEGVTFTVVLQDNGTTQRGGHDTSAAHTLTIHVLAVNDPPVYQHRSVVEVWEDEGPYVVPWGAPVGPGGGSDEAVQDVSFVTSLHDARLFIVPPTVDPDGTLRFATYPNAYGSATMRVRAHDDGGTELGGIDQTQDRTVLIRVRPVNDAPSFTPGPDIDITEKAAPDGPVPRTIPWARDVRWGPANESQQLSFTLVPEDPGLFGVAPQVDALGTLRFQAAADTYGQSVVQVCLKDDGGTERGGIDTAPCHTMHIRVRSVNDAPTFTPGPVVKVDEDSGRHEISWATDMSAGPPDEHWQTMHFSMVPQDAGIDLASLFLQPPSLASDGTLSFRLAPDAHGVVSFLVRLHDDGGRAMGGDDTSTPHLLELHITPRNDVPVPADDVYVVQEEATLLIDAPGVLANDVDVDGDALHARLVRAPDHGIVELQGTGALRYTPTRDYFGSDRLVYEVDDGHGATAQASVRFEIINVNDPPVAIPDYYVVVPGQTLSIHPAHGVLANDQDPDPDQLQARLVRDVTSGTLRLREDGAFTYAPEPGMRGTDHFVYMAYDGSTTNGQGIKVHLRVQERPGPQAAFAWSAHGLDVHFTDQSVGWDGVDPQDGTITPSSEALRAWRWQLGDGTTWDGPGLSHSYAAPGLYEVRLTVTDSHGRTDVAVHEVVVAQAAPRLADAQKTVPVGALVVLEADVLEGRPDEYSWKQVGGPDVVRDAAMFTAPQDPATLRFEVRGAQHGRWSAPATIRVDVVAPNLPRLSVDGPRIVDAGDEVRLRASLAGVPVKATWTQTHGPPLGLGGAQSPTIAFTATGPPGALIEVEAALGPTPDAPGGHGATHQVAIRPVPRPLSLSGQGDNATLQAPGEPFAWEWGGQVRQAPPPTPLPPYIDQLTVYVLEEGQVAAYQADREHGDHGGPEVVSDVPHGQRRIGTWIAVATVALGALAGAAWVAWAGLRRN